MSRSRNKKTRSRPKQSQADAERDVILDTAAVFTCSTEAAADFAYQCQSLREELRLDTDLTRLAHEFWAGRTGGPGKELADILAALLAERERFAAAVAELQPRLERLAAEDAVHEHLEPVEHYRELVRSKLFPHHPPVT